MPARNTFLPAGVSPAGHLRLIRIPLSDARATATRSANTAGCAARISTSAASAARCGASGTPLKDSEARRDRYVKLGECCSTWHSDPRFRVEVFDLPTTCTHFSVRAIERGRAALGHLVKDVSRDAFPSRWGFAEFYSATSPSSVVGLTTADQHPKRREGRQESGAA